jgi:hypothetical protein
MSLLSPERLVWLAAAIPIIACYLLRTRIRRAAVGTLQFWEAAGSATRRRAFSFRLRHWLSLLLQLGFVACLVAALVDPVRSGARDTAFQRVLILDVSASMQAPCSRTDPRPRWEAALAAARRQLAGSRPGDQWGLITAGNQVEVVAGMTDFTPQIETALDRLVVTDGVGRLEAAIDSARRLAPDPQRRQLLVITDGCTPPHDALARDALARDAAGKLRSIVVGEPLPNVAITQFQVRRSAVDPLEYSILISWQNFGAEAASGRLRLRHNDRLLDVHPYRLAAEERRQTTFQYSAATGGIVRAELTTADSFPLDDQAEAILPSRPPIPVSLVTSSSDPFLPRALDAMPRVELEVQERWLAARDQGQVTVLHRSVPDPLPRGPLLVIAPQTDSRFWELGPVVEETLVAEQAADSLLLANVQLRDTALAGVRPLRFKIPGEALLKSAEGGTILAAWTDQGRRIVVLATELRDSDLPLRVAFPVLMSNAIEWLNEAGFAGAIPAAVASGATVTLPPALVNEAAVMVDDSTAADRPAAGWRLEGPIAGGSDAAETVSASRVPLIIGEQRIQVGPFPRLGRYRLVHARFPADRPAATLAVNLTAPEESDLRPRWKPADTADERAVATTGGKPWWFYLCLVSLGLIIGEWYLFQRRIVA